MNTLSFQVKILFQLILWKKNVRIKYIILKLFSLNNLNYVAIDISSSTNKLKWDEIFFWPVGILGSLSC